MIDAPRLPDWPPPDGEAIGEERARAYVAWIREHAPPLLKEAREMIRARYPGVQADQSSVNVKDLATWHAPTPAMPGLAIGTVSASVSGGTWAMVDLLITHDGRLITRPGMNMRDRPPARAPGD
jgi:hypothetical protein